MDKQTSQKFLKLQEIIKSYDKVIVAYSGGVDSSFLLKVAADVQGLRISVSIRHRPCHPFAIIMQLAQTLIQRIIFQPELVLFTKRLVGLKLAGAGILLEALACIIQQFGTTRAAITRN